MPKPHILYTKTAHFIILPFFLLATFFLSSIISFVTALNIQHIYYILYSPTKKLNKILLFH